MSQVEATQQLAHHLERTLTPLIQGEAAVQESLRELQVVGTSLLSLGARSEEQGRTLTQQQAEASRKLHGLFEGWGQERQSTEASLMDQQRGHARLLQSLIDQSSAQVEELKAYRQEGENFRAAVDTHTSRIQEIHEQLQSSLKNLSEQLRTQHDAFQDQQRNFQTADVPTERSALPVEAAGQPT